MNTQHLYLWNSMQGLDDVLSVHTIIKDMNKGKSGYDAISNAQSLAQLIMYALPGNTLDLVLDKIAIALKSAYLSNPDFIQEPYDIQNRIRGALQDLCHLEDN